MVETKNNSNGWFELVIRGYLKPYIFLIEPLLEAKAKNLKKESLVFPSMSELGILLSRLTDL